MEMQNHGSRADGRCTPRGRCRGQASRPDAVRAREQGRFAVAHWHCIRYWIIRYWTRQDAESRVNRPGRHSITDHSDWHNYLAPDLEARMVQRVDDSTCCVRTRSGCVSALAALAADSEVLCTLITKYLLRTQKIINYNGHPCRFAFVATPSSPSPTELCTNHEPGGIIARVSRGAEQRTTLLLPLRTVLESTSLLQTEAGPQLCTTTQIQRPSRTRLDSTRPSSTHKMWKMRCMWMGCRRRGSWYRQQILVRKLICCWLAGVVERSTICKQSASGGCTYAGNDATVLRPCC
jgi:hypothetical protein